MIVVLVYTKSDLVDHLLSCTTREMDNHEREKQRILIKRIFQILKQNN